MIYLAVILVYLFALTGIGVVKSRQVKNQQDFAVAGRSLSPWVMVLTMLSVWIGTGSILGNAEEAYHVGMAALIIPLATFAGMSLLSIVATRARDMQATSVPEIIGERFGPLARLLAVTALITAYMVVVSYQFNAGGAVLEVIAGDKNPVSLKVGNELTRRQLTRGWVRYTPDPNFTGQVSMMAQSMDSPRASSTYKIEVVTGNEIAQAIKDREEKGQDNDVAIRRNNYTRIRYKLPTYLKGLFRIAILPASGRVELVEPKLTKETATIIAAVFIIAFTMLAGLLSLAYADIVTGIIIIVSLLIAFPMLLSKAGGFEQMKLAYDAMGTHGKHMQFLGVYSGITLINYLLPEFLLIMGDANQYQRIFASRNAQGAKKAVMMLIGAAVVIELLIIASAWIAGSMTPDPENGKYILIYAARHYMPFGLGLLFMVTVVGIIVSTADSHLLVPATTFINDVYRTYINPKAKEKHVVFVSRCLVLFFGVIAYLVTHAFSESTGFFKKALYAYTIYGSAITPSLIAAMFWKRATKAGAIASIATGIVVTLLWKQVDFFLSILPESFQQLNAVKVCQELDAVLPAITLSALALWVVSLSTGKRTRS